MYHRQLYPYINQRVALASWARSYICNYAYCRKFTALVFARNTAVKESFGHLPGMCGKII
jgi:hypothetical protein